MSLAAGAIAAIGLGVVGIAGTFPTSLARGGAEVTAQLGRELLGNSMLVFQTAGVVLLATMIGAKVPRLSLGLSILRRYSEPDEAGEAFLAGFYDWCERVLAASREWLERTGTEPEDFVHPFGSLLVEHGA